MNLDSIGRKIKEKRVAKSWSQEILAEKVGITPVYLGMIERGEKTPKLETFIRIANCLETTSDELLEDVLVKGGKIKLTRYDKEIDKLNSNEQKRLFKIMEAFLKL